LHADRKTTVLFFGQVEQKGSGYLQDAETKEESLPIPYAHAQMLGTPTFFHISMLKNIPNLIIH
jgi:hypothetical protein